MPTPLTTNPVIITSPHAAWRIAQRGVCQDALDLLTLHGTDLPAGNGRVRRELYAAQTAELFEEGYPLAVIEKAFRLEAIFTESGILVTCYQRTPRPVARKGRRRGNARRAPAGRRGGRA